MKSIPSQFQVYLYYIDDLFNRDSNYNYWYFFYAEGGKVSMMVFKSDNHTLIGTAKYGISLFTQAGFNGIDRYLF